MKWQQIEFGQAKVNWYATMLLNHQQNSLCRQCQQPAYLQCAACTADHCKQCHNSKAHRDECARVQVVVKASKIKQTQFLDGALNNTQLIAYICACMSREELYGRGYASVFMQSLCPGMYNGTLTIMRSSPTKYKPGYNCIEFSYMVSGECYTEHKYITWEKCAEYHDEYKKASVSLSNKRTTEFTCDSAELMEVRGHH